MTSFIQPPSYHAVMLENEIVANKVGMKNVSDMDKESNFDREEGKGADLMENQSHKKTMTTKREYPVGFAENHYVAWNIMRIALMTMGIVLGCRKNANIQCHGHRGTCGKYHQERGCRPRQTTLYGRCGRHLPTTKGGC